jgi:hypothetical protein
MKFKWTIEIEVDETWVADGFDMNDRAALDMLACRLPYANMSSELKAKVVAAPDAELIATTQGYKSVADRSYSKSRG